MSRRKKISLEEALQIFTVAELKELCKTVGIKGISTKKKAELIRMLTVSLMDINTFRRFCMFASFEEIQAFEHAFSHPYVEEEEIAPLYYWLETGYCFIEEDDHVLVMEEVIQMYHSLDQSFWLEHDRFHTLRAYLSAASHLYGVATIQTVVNLFNQWNDVKTTAQEIRQLYVKLDDRPELQDFAISDDLVFDEVLMEADHGYYAYDAVFEQQGSSTYYIPEKEEFLKYADEDYFEKTKQYKILLDYLIRVYGIFGPVAEEMCEDLMHSVHLGYLVEDIMQDLENRGVTMDAFHKDDLAKMILELIHHTRSIFYRGHTPSEAGGNLAFADQNKRSKRFAYQGREGKEDGSNVIPFPGNFTHQK